MLFIPDGARITAADTATDLTLSWPQCPGCSFAVTIMPDSGIGIESRIAHLVAEQKQIDSANAVDSIGDFDVINGPPQSFTTSSGHGYEIDNSCGDCANTDLLYGRPGYIATVSFGGSDDAPKLGRHLCEMMAVGKSFAWRD